MTGPEHYREAERLAVEAVFVSPAFNDLPYPEHVTGSVHVQELIGLAQVHATLALAAATAMSGRGWLDADRQGVGGMHPVDYTAWDDVCGVEGE